VVDATDKAMQPPLRVTFDRRLKLELGGPRIVGRLVELRAERPRMLVDANLTDAPALFPVTARIVSWNLSKATRDEMMNFTHDTWPRVSGCSIYFIG
jgi:hypothetical protein